MRGPTRTLRLAQVNYVFFSDYSRGEFRICLVEFRVSALKSNAVVINNTLFYGSGKPRGPAMRLGLAQIDCRQLRSKKKEKKGSNKEIVVLFSKRE